MRHSSDSPKIYEQSLKKIASFSEKALAFCPGFLYNDSVSGELWWKVEVFHSFHGVFHNP